jgi:mannose-6-phosphate isomerase-like protein (cupin superfamily)
MTASPPKLIDPKLIDKVDLQRAFGAVSEHWRPRVVAALNGQEVKLVKFQGPFVWHRHESEDELFLCWRGRFRLELREKTIEVGAGELVVVPRGVEHRPVADEEVEVLLFEPAATRNTGDVLDPRYTAP